MNLFKLFFISLLLIPQAACAATLTEKFEETYIPLGPSYNEASMAPVDFNSDGKFDGIVAIDSKGSRVLAFSFTGPSQIWSVSNPNIRAGNSDGVVIAADIDGDGRSSDVIAGAKGVYAINAGTVLWNFDASGGSIFSLALVDLDGDGTANEIVAGGHGIVYAMDENGISLWNFSEISKSAVESVSSIDLNEDGVGEGVLLSAAKSFYVLDSEGGRVWNKLASDNVYSVISADFDNDGYMNDIVVGSGDGNVTAFNSEGQHLWGYYAYVDPGNKIRLYPADLSETGIFGNVIINADTVHGLNSVGTRAWSGTHVGSAVAQIDFNGNGKMEGVLTGTSNNIYAIGPSGQQVGYYLLPNNEKKAPYNVTGATAISAADLDGDGYLDDVFGVSNGAYFALEHTTDAPAPAATTPAEETPEPEETPDTTPAETPKDVTVSLGDDRVVTEGTVVTLVAEATASLSTGKIVTYVWTEGTDLLTNEIDKNSYGKVFSVGEHVIKVVVTDDTGASSSDTVKVTVTAKETETPAEAPPEQTSPLLMVFLGVAIGVAVVGAILYFMKKKEPQDEWD
jgi:hypothetical protein